MTRERSDRNLAEILCIPSSSSSSPNSGDSNIDNKKFCFRQNSSDLKSSGSENDFVGYNHVERVVNNSTQCNLDSDVECSVSESQQPNNAYHRRSDSPFGHAYHSLPNLLVNNGRDNYVASRSNRSTQTFNVDDPVVIKACKLAESVVNHLLGTEKSSLWSCKRDGSDQAMCELVDQLLYKHEIPIRSMVKRLNINRNNGYSAFSAVADEVLCDGPTWSRIVALYAFGGYLVVHCRKQGLNEFANEITNFIGRYVGDKACDWIKKQGGWESLVDWQGKEESFGSKLFKGLVVTGLGFALLTTFVSWK
ncbi:Uncharacterised protein g8309 [Pycnogonum litorale]